MAQQLLAVFLVLALLLGAMWLLRHQSLPKLGLFAKPAGTPKQVNVLERVPLTPQHSLHLVQVADTFLVIAVSPSGCQSLATLPVPTAAGLDRAMPAASGLTT